MQNRVSLALNHFTGKTEAFTHWVPSLVGWEWSPTPGMLMFPALLGWTCLRLCKLLRVPRKPRGREKEKQVLGWEALHALECVYTSCQWAWVVKEDRSRASTAGMLYTYQRYLEYTSKLWNSCAHFSIGKYVGFPWLNQHLKTQSKLKTKTLFT